MVRLLVYGAKRLRGMDSPARSCVGRGTSAGLALRSALAAGLATSVDRERVCAVAAVEDGELPVTERGLGAAIVAVPPRIWAPSHIAAPRAITHCMWLDKEKTE